MLYGKFDKQVYRCVILLDTGMPRSRPVYFVSTLFLEKATVFQFLEKFFDILLRL